MFTHMSVFCKILYVIDFTDFAFLIFLVDSFSAYKHIISVIIQLKERHQ